MLRRDSGSDPERLLPQKAKRKRLMLPNWAGIPPVSWLPCMYSTPRLVMLPSSAGTEPVSQLLSRYRYRRLVKLPSWVGMAPENLLLLMVSRVRSPRLAIQTGIEPVNLLLSIYKSWSAVKLAISEGSGPERLLLYRCKTVNPERSPIWAGMAPDILLWVSAEDRLVRVSRVTCWPLIRTPLQAAILPLQVRSGCSGPRSAFTLLLVQWFLIVTRVRHSDIRPALRAGEDTKVPSEQRAGSRGAMPESVMVTTASSMVKPASTPETLRVSALSSLSSLTGVNEKAAEPLTAPAAIVTVNWLLVLSVE